MYFNQSGYDVRCEWGSNGISQLLSNSDVVIIVDVLSFSTCVDVAVGNGAFVYPYRWRDESAADFAKSIGAVLALPRRIAKGAYSLSPMSLLNIPTGTRLVLPSPNGASLSTMTGNVPTYVGCLRNAEAVARAAEKAVRRISVIPAGEKWEDGSLRPALEDLIGAGAIIHYLTGTRSPESKAAVTAFIHFRETLLESLRQCSSGKELIALGFGADVELAAALNQSGCAPVLREGAYASSFP